MHGVTAGLTTLAHRSVCCHSPPRQARRSRRGSSVEQEPIRCEQKLLRSAAHATTSTVNRRQRTETHTSVGWAGRWAGWRVLSKLLVRCKSWFLPSDRSHRIINFRSSGSRWRQTHRQKRLSAYVGGGCDTPRATMDWTSQNGRIVFSPSFEQDGVRLFELDPAVLDALRAGERSVLPMAAAFCRVGRAHLARAAVLTSRVPKVKMLCCVPHQGPSPCAVCKPPIRACWPN